jgi:hypothetical protein
MVRGLERHLFAARRGGLGGRSGTLGERIKSVLLLLPFIYHRLPPASLSLHDIEPLLTHHSLTSLSPVYLPSIKVRSFHLFRPVVTPAQSHADSHPTPLPFPLPQMKLSTTSILLATLSLLPSLIAAQTTAHCSSSLELCKTLQLADAHSALSVHVPAIPLGLQARGGSGDWSMAVPPTTEEVGKMTNGERFRRGLGPAKPKKRGC